MTIRIREIDHVVLRVSDVARAIRFYCDVLGCTVERRLDDVGLYQLRAGRSLIDLVDVNGEIGRRGGAAPGAGGRNVDHLALRIETFDEAALRRHLEGLAWRPGTCTSATAPKATARPCISRTPRATRWN